jgi:hypothetical protein
MRLYEFADTRTILTEEMLRESFLNSVKDFLGTQAGATVLAVRDAFGAAQVIYKVIRSHQVLVSVVHELKTEIAEGVTKLAKLPMMAKVGKTFRKFAGFARKLLTGGYGVKDFLQSLGLIAMVNMLKKLSISLAVDQLKDLLVELTVQASALAERIVSTLDLMGFFALITALKIANDLLFETLNSINRKISGKDYQHYDPANPPDEEAPHVEPKQPTDMSLWKRIAASMHAQPGLLGTDPRAAQEIANRYAALGGGYG